MPTFDPTEWELSTAQEPYALKDGEEVKLRIMEVRKETRPSDDTEYFNVRLEVPDQPFSKEIAHFLNVPDRKLMNAKQINVARNEMQKFLAAFEIDTERPFDPTEDWPGQEGWCILGMRKSDQYGEQNYIKKLIGAR